MKRLTAIALLSMLLMGKASAMTEEDLHAIYQDSFSRMNTRYDYDIMTSGELAAFEAEYTHSTGRERKEDLIISSLPGERDMPYEEALAYARQLIMDTFGTPESELDAMGVYPALWDYVYMDRENEWAFYFSSVRDADLMMDHPTPGPGEYRVEFGAETGDVLLCIWYIDDFWPDYAQRAWDAGKRDEVYARAQRKEFYQQSPESQRHFHQLFEQAGYASLADAGTYEALLAAMRTELQFIQPEESILNSDFRNVRLALDALEQRYGLTRDMLSRCGFTACYSPLQTGTVDICFAYNYNREMELLQTGELNAYTGQLFRQLERLGLFMVSLDETGEAAAITHIPNEVSAVPSADASGLLGRLDWTSADLPEFDALMQRLEGLLAPELAKEFPDRQLLEALTDTLMRSAGGDPQLYSRRAEADTDIGAEKAEAIALQAIMDHLFLTESSFSQKYSHGDVQYENTGVYALYVWEKTLGLENYLIRIDAATGAILTLTPIEGNG